MDLDNFLQQSKEALSNLQDYDRVRVVMGNGTCDLDSAVCALVQGYLEYLDTKEECEFNRVAIIPLMNIPRREYCIKTEVVYVFKHYKISPDLLTFRDEIDLKGLTDRFAGTTLEVVLVDHHALPEEDSFLTDSVIRVIDHRPRDTNWPWPDRDVCIETVGSCATLVARRFLDAHLAYSDCRIEHLLRETKRTTPVDIETLERLEHSINHTDSEDYQFDDRNTVYSRLIQARNDISGLSLNDLLIKDLKVVEGVPIVQMPLLVRKFIAAEPWPIPFDAICNFAVARNTRKVVLCGMLIGSDEMKREFALFSLSCDSDNRRFDLADNASIRSSEIFKEMRMQFYLAEPSLELRNGETLVDANGKWEILIADQTNLAVTRKHIVPMVRNIIENVPDFKSNNQFRPKWVEEKSDCSSSP
ncbi:exopolyphosphatase PRUNE1-like isoform X2 [Halictus rubicundus]|uniref:exopolyphosphatase PRUNE1-like isoform X2 n=1 Tax=Halictus rubicundus TaxID=77578 RepID=UPI0040362B0B